MIKQITPFDTQDNLPEIFRIIHNNYDILKSYGIQKFDKNQRITVPAYELHSKGFNFDYYTSFKIDLWEKVRLYCFGLGWAKVNEDIVELDFNPEQL